MLNKKYLDFINEDMSAISNRRLRDAVHDVIIELKLKQTIDVEELSYILMSDYKINISPSFLDKFLDDFIELKKGKKNSSIFTRQDTRWLGIREVKGAKEMRNNLLYLKPSLTKHKRRLFAEDDKKLLDDAYKSGMKNLSFSENIIKRSLVLQKPGDSIDIIKYIYNDVIVKKLYQNTYDNCWKLMMLIAKKNNLDRIRGWFKMAPQSVKNEYNKHKKISYDLTKQNPKDPIKKPKMELLDIDVPVELKPNLNKIDQFLFKYLNWSDFIKNVDLNDLIVLINSLDIKLISDDFNKFLSKIDNLNLILIKYYRVEKTDIIMFYKNIGLASFLREWEQKKTMPKIKDF